MAAASGRLACQRINPGGAALSFTLDTNRVIAVGEERPEAEAVHDLVARQRVSLATATVRLVVAMAAGTPPKGLITGIGV